MERPRLIWVQTMFHICRRSKFRTLIEGLRLDLLGVYGISATINRKVYEMADALANVQAAMAQLTVDVAANTAVISAAKAQVATLTAAVAALQAQIAAAGAPGIDPVAVQAVADQITALDATLKSDDATLSPTPVPTA